MFFILSKIVDFLIYPIHFIFLLILVYLISLRINFLKRCSGFILFIISLCILLGGLGFIPNYFLWKLENEVNLILPKEAEGIILLGGSFNNIKKPFELKHASLNSSSERVVESLFLLNEYEDSKLIMVAKSGSIKLNGPSEAEMANLFFKKFNIDERRLHIKPIAKNTYQESIFISDYISKIGGNWIIVTSASHMPRALNLFQSRTLNKAIIYPYPTDHTTDKPKLSFNYNLVNLEKYSNVIHEYLGLIVYWLTGRTKNLWPNLNLIPINQPIK